MVIATSLKHSICSLFEVFEDEGGTHRVVTPMEYGGSNDRIVVRVRPLGDGTFQIDENGEAAMFASMSGGDIGSEVITRWIEDQGGSSPATFDPKSELVV